MSLTVTFEGESTLLVKHSSASDWLPRRTASPAHQACKSFKKTEWGGDHGKQRYKRKQTRHTFLMYPTPTKLMQKIHTMFNGEKSLKPPFFFSPLLKDYLGYPLGWSCRGSRISPCARRENISHGWWEACWVDEATRQKPRHVTTRNSSERHHPQKMTNFCAQHILFKKFYAIWVSKYR